MISAFGVDHQNISKAFGNDRSSGKPTLGRRVAHTTLGGWHTIGASRKGRRLENLGRDMGAGVLGALPGAGVAAAGGAALGAGKSKLGIGLTAAGLGGAVAGTQIARQKNLTAMNRKGYLKPQNVSKADSERKKDQRRVAAGLTLLPIAGSAYQASQARKGRKAANFWRPVGRHYLEGAAGALPGQALGTVGAMTGKPGLSATGQVLGSVGAMAGRAHGGYAAMRSAQRRGDVR